MILSNAARSGYESQKALGDAIGYAQQTMSYKLLHASRMTLRDLGVIARKTRMPDEDIVAIVKEAGR